jgi:serine/threonine-protein kinase
MSSRPILKKPPTREAPRQIGWITIYQARKLLSGHCAELMIGHYVVLDKLGEGGMGKVYKAKQLRLNRIVALKVIRPNLIANEMALKRFRREAKAAAQLTHPNIVRLFDADQIGDRHFLAMEFIDGSDPALIKKIRSPPIGMASSFIRQAATGLQHAHDLGLVHRDVAFQSAGDVAAERQQDRAGRRHQDPRHGSGPVAGPQDCDSAETALTQDGAVIGNPTLCRQNRRRIPVPSMLVRIFTAGLHFLLPADGQRHFQWQHAGETAPASDGPAPARSNTATRSAHEVAAIVHMLLAKRPEDRFQNGTALAQALEPWSVFDSNARLNGGPAPARRSCRIAAIQYDAAAATTEGAINFDSDSPDNTEPTRLGAGPRTAARLKRQLWWILRAQRDWQSSSPPSLSAARC